MEPISNDLAYVVALSMIGLLLAGVPLVCDNIFDDGRRHYAYAGALFIGCAIGCALRLLVYAAS